VGPKPDVGSGPSYIKVARCHPPGPSNRPDLEEACPKSLCAASATPQAAGRCPSAFSLLVGEVIQRARPRAESCCVSGGARAKARAMRARLAAQVERRRKKK